MLFLTLKNHLHLLREIAAATERLAQSFRRKNGHKNGAVR